MCKYLSDVSRKKKNMPFSNFVIIFTLYKQMTAHFIAQRSNINTVAKEREENESSATVSRSVLCIFMAHTHTCHEEHR